MLAAGMVHETVTFFLINEHITLVHEPFPLGIFTLIVSNRFVFAFDFIVEIKTRA